MNFVNGGFSSSGSGIPVPTQVPTQQETPPIFQNPYIPSNTGINPDAGLPYHLDEDSTPPDPTDPTDPNYETLEPVVVHGSYNSKMMLFGGIGLAALALAMQKKKPARKKVGAIGEVKPMTVLLIGGGVVGFIVVKKLLEKLGVVKSANEKSLENASNDPGSYWNPSYWQKAPNGALILKDAAAENFLAILWTCFGMFDDDEEKIYGLFKQLKTKSQVSYLSWYYTKTRGGDFLNYMYAGSWPSDGLSADEMADIKKYTDQLPAYTV